MAALVQIMAWRQAIIWSNIGMLYWRIFASLGRNELKLPLLHLQYSGVGATKPVSAIFRGWGPPSQFLLLWYFHCFSKRSKCQHLLEYYVLVFDRHPLTPVKYECDSTDFTSCTFARSNWSLIMKELTLLGPVTPFGDIDLGQHWLRLWLAAWWHQAITWTNVDLSSVRSCGIHLRAIS